MPANHQRRLGWRRGAPVATGTCPVATTSTGEKTHYSVKPTWLFQQLWLSWVSNLSFLIKIEKLCYARLSVCMNLWQLAEFKIAQEVSQSNRHPANQLKPS